MVPVPLALGSSGATPPPLPGGAGLVRGNTSSRPAAGQPEHRSVTEESFWDLDNVPLQFRRYEGIHLPSFPSTHHTTPHTHGPVLCTQEVPVQFL